MRGSGSGSFAGVRRLQSGEPWRWEVGSGEVKGGAGCGEAPRGGGGQVRGGQPVRRSSGCPAGLTQLCAD